MKLIDVVATYSRESGVNLPRWGLKRSTGSKLCTPSPSVNLPRWGLKQPNEKVLGQDASSVNLPRWGLKHVGLPYFAAAPMCKFTPLGFETVYKTNASQRRASV